MAVKTTPSCAEYSARTRRDVFLQMRSSKFTVCLLFVLVFYCTVLVVVLLHLCCISRVLFSSCMSGRKVPFSSFDVLVNTFSFPFTRALKQFRTFYRGLNWIQFFCSCCFHNLLTFLICRSNWTSLQLSVSKVHFYLFNRIITRWIEFVCTFYCILSNKAITKILLAVMQFQQILK